MYVHCIGTLYMCTLCICSVYILRTMYTVYHVCTLHVYTVHTMCTLYIIDVCVYTLPVFGCVRACVPMCVQVCVHCICTLCVFV